MQVKMCVLGGLLLFLMVVCICLLTFSAYGETPHENVSLSWGEMTPTETDETIFTLPIYIQNVPPGGFCGMLFCLDIQGDATVQQVTLGEMAVDLCLTYRVENTSHGQITGILLDGAANNQAQGDGILCAIMLTYAPTQVNKLSLICDGMAVIDSESQVISLPVGVPNVYETSARTQETSPDTSSDEQPETKQEEVQTQAEILTETPDLPMINGIFVGVQDNISQVTTQAETGHATTYAVRFLFMIDTANPPPQALGCVVCIHGGGVLNLSCDIRKILLSLQGSEQVSLTPAHADQAWLTYTYTGLSTDGNYTFTVYDSQGSVTVTYQNGIYDWTTQTKRTTLGVPAIKQVRHSLF